MKLAALGDLFLGDQLACLGYGVRSYCDRHGYDHLFDGVRTKLKRYDLVVANLETVLSRASGRKEDSLHRVLNRGSPSAAAAIKRGGIHLLSLANNHIFDYGPTGLEDTIAALESAGLSHCGTAHKSVHVHEQNGSSYAFLSWSLVPDSATARKFYNVTNDPAEIIAEIRGTRPQANKIILSLHAGNEFVTQPSAAFASTCRQLIDAGVDIILGHHPHVLQPIERYHDGLIAYSLGNFVICSWDLKSRTGMILGLSTDEPQSVESTFFELSNNNYSPIPLSDADRIDDLSQHLRSLSPLPSEAYLSEVRRLRNGYRISTLLHVLKNLYRTKRRFEFLRLAIRRILYLWSIRKVERDRPDLVYMDPKTHLGRSRE